MLVTLSPLAGAGWQFFDNNGIPLSGGLLYTYVAGTSTPLGTYTSSTGNVLNSNPIVLDSAGRISNEIWLIAGSAYKFVLQNSNSNQIWTKDNITSVDDASQIFYNQGSSNAVTRTVQNKLQEIVSLQDFGAVGDGVTDDTTAITNWLTYLYTNSIAGFVPSGNYVIGSLISFTVGTIELSIIGEGKNVSNFIIPSTNSTGGFVFTSTARNCQVLFKDFGMITKSQGGVGIGFNMPEGGNQHQRTFVADGIQLTSYDQTSNYFDTYLSIQGHYHPLCHDVTISGINSADQTDSSPAYFATYAVNCLGSYAPDFTNCMFFGAKTLIYSSTYLGTITSMAASVITNGYTTVTVSSPSPFQNGNTVLITGSSVSNYNSAWTISNVSSNQFQFDIPTTFTTSPTGAVASMQNSPEGFSMEKCVLNTCQIGISIYRPTRQPRFLFTDLDINFRNYGILLNGALQVNVKGCSFYNQDSTQQFSAPIDIYLQNGSDYEITNNFFWFNHTNPNRVNIQADYSNTLLPGYPGSSGIISQNEFESGGLYAVNLASGTRNVQVGPNTIGTNNSVLSFSSMSNYGDGTSVMTVTGTNPFNTGDSILISGASVSGYNGSWVITSQLTSNTFNITAPFTSTSTGSVQLLNGSYTGIATLSNVAITGTAGQFSCSPAIGGIANGQQVIVSGTNTGTGSITGYSNPTTYYIISTNGSTTFTLSSTFNGSAITTTAGTTTGLTFKSSATLGAGLVNDPGSLNNIIQFDTNVSGSWTPVLSFGGSSTGITYSTQTGSYRISGQSMTYEINITLTSKGTATGNATISLPYPFPGAQAIAANNGVGNFSFYSGMNSISSPIARVLSALSLGLSNQSTTAVSSLTDTNFNNNSSITIIGTILLT